MTKLIPSANPAQLWLRQELQHQRRENERSEEPKKRLG